jgi:hypothetical protein
MIDRGLVWNWAIPVGLFLGAIIVTAILITLRRNASPQPA